MRPDPISRFVAIAMIAIGTLLWLFSALAIAGMLIAGGPVGRHEEISMFFFTILLIYSSGIVAFFVLSLRMKW
jgi:hypothetical protein